jgi:glutamyl/glutaminyl-tRNA synthetase
MIEDMQWFGLVWNGGYFRDQSESIQSRRFALYEMAWFILYQRGFIYPCKQSRKDVEQALSAPHDDIIDRRAAVVEDLQPQPQPQPHLQLQSEVIFPSYLRPDFIRAVAYGIGNNFHFPADFQDLRSPSSTDLDHHFEQRREEQRHQPQQPQQPQQHRSRTNWRFRVPDDLKSIDFEDVFAGKQSFTPGVDFGDFLIWRVDGFPSYELAVVVDDVLMGVTEVVRGQDLLLSTARQLLVMKALFGLDYDNDDHWHAARPLNHLQECHPPCGSSGVGGGDPLQRGQHDSAQVEGDLVNLFSSPSYRIPRYFHAPLMLDDKGIRMAKRNFSKSIRTLRAEGQLPRDIRRQFFNKDLFSIL